MIQTDQSTDSDAKHQILKIEILVSSTRSDPDTDCAGPSLKTQAVILGESE